MTKQIDEEKNCESIFVSILLWLERKKTRQHEFVRHHTKLKEKMKFYSRWIKNMDKKTVTENLQPKTN